MKKVYIWVIVAILGFLMYISPSFFVQHMYEGFAAVSPVTTATTATATAATAAKGNVVPLVPSPAPKITPPNQNAIANLEQILNTPVLTSPTASVPVPVADGLRALPQEYETTRSRPESASAQPVPSEALKQGQDFAETKPVQTQLTPLLKTPAEKEVIVRKEIVVVPGANPSCPDMRDYIRKDSIPCWGCKLGR